MLELILVTLASLFAGCIDAIVGGGGLILVPALFAAYPGATPASPAALIRRAADIDLAFLDGVRVLGLTAGASTPTAPRAVWKIPRASPNQFGPHTRSSSSVRAKTRPGDRHKKANSSNSRRVNSCAAPRYRTVP